MNNRTLKLEGKEERVPKSVNSEENSRIKASMVDKLGLTHLQSLRHPVQESKISLEIEVDELCHKIPTPSWACSLSIDIPFWEINSVINWLNSQQSKSQQERKGTQNID